MKKTGIFKLFASDTQPQTAYSSTFQYTNIDYALYIRDLRSFFLSLSFLYIKDCFIIIPRFCTLQGDFQPNFCIFCNLLIIPYLL